MPNIVYVVVIDDRHVEPKPQVFSTPDAAISYASQFAASSAAACGEQLAEERVEHFLYYAVYSGDEGDSVWVVEKTVDQPDKL